uniref:HTH OST-type domain-containing protein n=1 Tax=Timema genevievae TaxID=629358 RepID=A0A7R9PN09_TIMGE|nr:unnamed protein product [Timema genevievae]
MSSLEKHDVINLIKSCLLSVQGSISINKLDDDYLLLEGTRIPFKKFGSTSLEYFLKTIPEIEFTRNRFGHTLVNARPSKSTEHIASFVAKQRPKQRSRHGNVYLHNHMRTSIPSSRYSQEHSFRNKTEHVQSNFEVPPRFKKDVLSPLRNEQPEKLSARVETSIPEKLSDKITIATKVTPFNKIVKSSSNRPERTNVSLRNHNKFLVPSQKTDLEENMLDDTYTNSTIISPLTPLRARLLASSTKKSPTLQVNNFRNPTLPMECKSSGEVLQIAAKQPFEDFRKLPQTLRNSMSDQSIKEFVDDQSIITMNIIKLLNSFPSGIWAENLPHFYTKTFGETLPENWGLVIKVNPRINIEEPVPGKSIIFLSTEISPKSLSSNLDEISLQQVVPPPLILPETAEWDIYITVVTPDVNIYVRLLGEDYSIIYDNMATDMELYYMNTIAVVDNPIVGNYYAIKLDDCWHRVRVQEIQEQQEGRLFFIDQGDEEWHPLSSLCHLEPKFAQIPAQAVLCRLHGLEEFIHHPLTCGILTSLVVGKSMIARLIPQASENDQAVSVVVFDTHTDDDVNINFLLAESITHSVSHPFDLPVDIFSLTSLTATLPLFLIPTSAATRPKLEPGDMVLNGEGKRASILSLLSTWASSMDTFPLRSKGPEHCQQGLYRLTCPVKP